MVATNNFHYVCSQNDVKATSDKLAYEMTTIEADHEYEVIGSTRPPPVAGGAVLEGMYDVPVNATPQLSSSQPLPKTTPSSESEAVTKEKKPVGGGAYCNITIKTN